MTEMAGIMRMTASANFPTIEMALHFAGTKACQSSSRVSPWQPNESERRWHVAFLRPFQPVFQADWSAKATIPVAAKAGSKQKDVCHVECPRQRPTS